MSNLLSLVNLTKKYHTKEGEIEAIEDITMDVKKGEIIAILGPSGCGKSTILSIIADLDNKTSGNLLKKSDLVISYMLQNDALFNWMTIYENAIIGLKIQNKMTEEHLKYVDYLFEFYNLSEFKNNYPESLSGGMKQRVACIQKRHYLIKNNNRLSIHT